MASYRDAEKKVADAESALQLRYGQGVSATYVCSKCSRFAYEHADHDVKNCTLPAITADDYTARLAKQVDDLRGVLDDRDKLLQMETSLEEQKELSDLRMVKLGAFMQKVKRIQKRMKNAFEERTTAACDDKEFFEQLAEVYNQVKDLNITNVMSPSPTAVDSSSEDSVPPPRAPYIYTPMRPTTPPPPPPSTPPPRTTGSGLTSPPRLKEQPGVTIIHETSGDICGGSPDGNKIIRCMKSVDCGEFSASQGGIKFLQTKNKLFTFLSICCPTDTMYTHVAILYRLAPTLKYHLDNLTKMKNHFTSFAAFFKEFELLVYPDLESIVQMKIAKFSQGTRTVRSYYSDFAYLLNEIGMEEDRFVLHFIDNLSDARIKNAMQARPLSIAEDSMKAIADHASRMEELSTNGKESKQSSVASVDKQQKRDKGKKTVSVANASTSSYWEDQRKQALEKARETSIKNCVMCAGNHKFESIAECSVKRCLFCDKNTRQRGAHFSILCKRAPSNARDLKAAFDQA